MKKNAAPKLQKTEKKALFPLQPRELTMIHGGKAGVANGPQSP